MKSYFFRYFLAGAFVVPLSEKGQWQVFEFKNIPAHKIEFSSEGLSIQVQQSANPVLLPVEPAKKISGIQVEGEIEGALNLPADIVQGEKGADDFILKVGLVAKGTQTLSRLQYLFAADWVKKLFNLAPKDVGIEKIYFFNVVGHADLVGKTRTHWMSELVYEQYVWSLKKSGNFDLSYQLKRPVETLGLWVASDGDDTKSTFKIRIKKLALIQDN